MHKMKDIRGKLRSLNGRDYGAYQSLLGPYAYPHFRLFIDRIPKDPYAPPHTGIYRVQVPRDYIEIPEGLEQSKIRETAFCDFLARRFFQKSSSLSEGRRGTGYSGIITIAEPGQAILRRSSVAVCDDCIEVRLFAGLPAGGRRIKSDVAEEMLLEELPRIVEQALFKENIDSTELGRHLATAEDADYLRKKLESQDLIAFIADGAVLPRKSGTSDMPLALESAVALRSPEHLRVEFQLPHAGRIQGMGIPGGITLIVGGGYHGKSTLLEAIEQGIYNHIPGDGREQCVSLYQTVKVRAHSGRSVEKVDISTFIKNLPANKDTTAFSTENASGSTSQAASIQEAVEMGARVLLMDEDTCATNFMIRDRKMQQLVRKDDEPITTYIDKAGQLFSEKGISSILVLGGAGDYFEIADTVIQMTGYRPFDVTEKAREIAGMSPAKRTVEDEGCPVTPRERILMPGCIDPYNEYHKKSVYAREVHTIHFGKTIIDLTDVEQLIELSQTKAVIQSLLYVNRYIDGKKTLHEIIDMIMREIDANGLDVIDEKISGHYAEFRGLELACAINRLRGVKMMQK